MRTIWVLPLVLLTGCDFLAKKTAEVAVEKATGTELDIDGENVTITAKDKDGKSVKVETTGEGDQKQVVVESADGKAVIKGDAKSGAADIKTKNGTIKMRTEAPKDFPLPLFEAGEVVRSVKMDNKAQGKIHIVSMKTEKSAETAGEFYKKALKDKGLEVVANESKMGEMTMVNLSGKKDKIVVGVNVMNNSDGTVINISWNEKP